MKIIFLDFDGVLNSFQFLRTQTQTLDAIDPAAVKRLNSIVSRSGAKVVVSSTWRLKLSLEELRARLSALGFLGEIIDRTPEIQALNGSLVDPFMSRSDEIRAWLEAQAEPIESFVILDDAYLEEVAQYLVKTELETGLQDEHVSEALQILGEL